MRLDRLGGRREDPRRPLRARRGLVGALRGGRGGGRGARRERVPVLGLVEPRRAPPGGVRRGGARAIRAPRRPPRRARPRAGRHAPPLHPSALVPRGDALDLDRLRRHLRAVRRARRPGPRPGGSLLDGPERAVRPRPRRLPRRTGAAGALLRARRRPRARPPPRRARGRGGGDPRGCSRGGDRRRSQHDGVRTGEDRGIRSTACSSASPTASTTGRSSTRSARDAGAPTCRPSRASRGGGPASPPRSTSSA